MLSLCSLLTLETECIWAWYLRPKIALEHPWLSHWYMEILGSYNIYICIKKTLYNMDLPYYWIARGSQLIPSDAHPIVSPAKGSRCCCHVAIISAEEMYRHVGTSGSHHWNAHEMAGRGWWRWWWQVVVVRSLSGLCIPPYEVLHFLSFRFKHLPAPIVAGQDLPRWLTLFGTILTSDQPLWLDTGRSAATPLHLEFKTYVVFREFSLGSTMINSSNFISISELLLLLGEAFRNMFRFCWVNF